MLEKDSAQVRRALLEKYRRGQMPRAEAVERIPRRQAGDFAPLSFGQQQLWLLSRLLPDVPAYTECVTIHLPGPLNVPVLERSFNEILKRHEAWRTSFPLVNGEPVQYIHPVVNIDLPVVDLCHLPPLEREPEALRLMTEDAEQPFDLASGPLLRPTLIRLADTDHRLFLTLHHIIFDGYSLYQIFLPELRALYDAFLASQPSPLSKLPIQYADFAAWQRERAQKETVEKQLVYWKKQLAGIPATLELPTDRPRPPVSTYRGLMYPFALMPKLTGAIEAIGGEGRGTPETKRLQAAFERPGGRTQPKL
jgi:hypothetical protein